MANIMAIAGESGAGKTTSMMYLPHESTFYVDADGKGLSWKGWKAQYCTANKNYIRTSDVEKITSYLDRINRSDEFRHIKVVVIDTINAIMIDDEMNRMKEKGYDKWADLAFSVYGLIKYAMLLRDDLTVIFVAHTQTERDDNGNVWTRIKTSGKKLDKIALESKFPVVLIAKVIDGNHMFETHANNSTAKTPYGCFDEPYIPNNMEFVLTKMKEYME